MKQDASSSLSMLRRNSTSSSSSRDPKNEPSYTDLIERLRRCETKLGDIETQLRSAETMVKKNICIMDGQGSSSIRA